VAEALKQQFGALVVTSIASMIQGVYPRFDATGFSRDVLDAFEPLALMARAERITSALQRYLPADYAAAIDILLASIGDRLNRTDRFGMAPFLYLPYVLFVARYGTADFETSMRAQYELTHRFTAEFSIRTFLRRYPAETLARLRDWALDPSPHVRRLVSEGTRPRLPWAERLVDFQRDPTPVLELLELLRDDPEDYVRRSVANNLNDIAKDHPARVLAVAEQWLVDATPSRRRLVQHGLRSLVKAGDARALRLLGFAATPAQIAGIRISPKRPHIGDALTIELSIHNPSRRPTSVNLDLRVHYQKAHGRSKPKVFKLKRLSLTPDETAATRKTISLADMSTRKHHPGRHRVEALINGRAVPLGEFWLYA
jgi:3-methyladenine DNA glycosylase AlkC